MWITYNRTTIKQDLIRVFVDPSIFDKVIEFKLMKGEILKLEKEWEFLEKFVLE